MHRARDLEHSAIIENSVAIEVFSPVMEVYRLFADGDI